MADTVDLAGVIGTWVAVFLALVALLGLLPAYILYRRSRTEKAQALSTVDDPGHEFTSIRRVFGTIVHNSAQVPDLRYAPDPCMLQETYLSNVGGRDFRKSSTGWVEFAHVIRAAFPEVRLGGADLLVFEQGQSYLPVSQAWLIALGVLHRVAIRQDHGLPLRADVEANSPTLLPEPRLSGVSCYLDHVEREDRFSEKTYISFDMHDLPDEVQPPSSGRDHMCLRTLYLLFKGYVEGGNGRLYSGRLRVQWRSSLARDRRVHDAIANIKEKDLSSGSNVLQGVRVQARTKASLSIQYRGVQKILGDAASNRRGYYNVGLWPVSRRERRRRGGGWDVWMLRKEVHRLVFVYLRVKPSPRGFLFDKRDDIVISLILRSKAVGRFLRLARTWLSGLHLTTEQHGQFLADLEVISSDIVNTQPQTSSARRGAHEVSWSRRLMQAIAFVDETIDVAMKNKGVTMWEFIRAIHICDAKFEESIEAYLDRIHAGEHGPKVVVDLTAGTIIIPQADGSQQDRVEIEMDFGYTLAETKPHDSLRHAEIDPSHVVFACLQGQLRVIAWKMALSPKGLLDLLGNDGRNSGNYLVTPNKFDTMRVGRWRGSRESSESSESNESTESNNSGRSSAE